MQLDFDGPILCKRLPEGAPRSRVWDAPTDFRRVYRLNPSTTDKSEGLPGRLLRAHAARGRGAPATTRDRGLAAFGSSKAPITIEGQQGSNFGICNIARTRNQSDHPSRVGMYNAKVLHSVGGSPDTRRVPTCCASSFSHLWLV
jgi:hypothetical protein